MRVFISWSGPQAQLMAESLKEWLPLVIQVAQPFVSSQDISVGDRPLPVIAQELEQTSSGIICVTRENSLKPWINFEAGALSKTVGQSRVIPCLLDLPPSDLTGPIAQFQAVPSSDKAKVLAMVQSLRDHAGLSHPTDAQLAATFNAFWPNLEAKFDEARSVAAPADSATPTRDAGEILEEVLVLARRQESVLRTIAERVDSAAPLQHISKGRASASSERPETDRLILDELLTALSLPADRATAYSYDPHRLPESFQAVYEAETISTDNMDAIQAEVEAFATLKSLLVTVRSTDGYEIISSPGKPSVVLTPPKPPEPAPEPPGPAPTEALPIEAPKHT
ncbi:hypothetical protein ACWD4G_23105 [Streptomyces sp. NPDC002643]